MENNLIDPLDPVYVAIRADLWWDGYCRGFIQGRQSVFAELKKFQKEFRKTKRKPAIR